MVKIIRRQRKRRDKHPQLLPLFFIILLCFGIAFFASQIFMALPGIDHLLARSILSWGMPTISGEELGYPGWDYTARSLIYMITDYDLGNPQSFLKNTLPTITSLQRYQVFPERSFTLLPELGFAPEPTRPSASLLDPILMQDRLDPSESSVRALPSDPQVLIYHTHSSEMYLGPLAAQQNYRDAHYVFRSASDEKTTGVMEVGRHLAKALQRYGISVLHDTRIHDFPSLARSYLNSERTVREILGRHPNIQFVFDVHRDAGVPEPVVIINGKRVAKVLLVLGTAQDIPQEHANWQKNLQFAHELQRTAESMYPGLMRPIQVRRDARYNQHLHPNSVILEIGSVDNTLEEGLLAAELLAAVIQRIMGNQ